MRLPRLWVQVSPVKKSLIFFISCGLMLASNGMALAVNYDFNKNSGINETAGGQENSVSGSSVGGAGYDTSASDLPSRIGSIINIALSLLGVVILGFLIYAGFLWMTARGEEKQVEEAKNIIKNSIIGLIIILSAYAITLFMQGFVSA